jgi:hypothetical protein
VPASGHVIQPNGSFDLMFEWARARIRRQSGGWFVRYNEKSFSPETRRW